MSVQIDIITETIEVQIIEDEVVNIQILDGISVYTDSTLAGIARAINFISGSNITISAISVDGIVQVTLNSSASGGGGSGDVVGPSGATADDIAVFNGITGKIIKDGVSKVSDLVPKTTTVNSQSLSSNIIIPDGLYYMRTGKYLMNSLTGIATGVINLGANSLRASPFIIVKSITFTELTTEVSTPVGSTTYRVGIYTDDGNSYPNQLVVGTDVGTYDSSTATIKSSGAVNIILTPGLYWLAVNSNGGPTLRGIAVAGLPQVFGADAIGVNPINTRWAASLSYQQMPSSFPAGATAASIVISPAVGLLL